MSVEAQLRVTSASVVHVKALFVNKSRNVVQLCNVGWSVEIAGMPAGAGGRSVHCNADEDFENVQPGAKAVMTELNLVGLTATRGDSYHYKGLIVVEKGGQIVTLETSGRLE